MIRRAYSAWFRNQLLAARDEDHEWVAVIVIEAETSELAWAWGDHLAKSYSNRNPQEAAFLWSEVRALDDPMYDGTTQSWDESPLVLFGHEATEDQIGW